MSESLGKIIVYLASGTALFFLLKIISGKKHKKQIHQVCFINVAVVFLWTLVSLFNEIYFYINGRYTFILFFCSSVCLFLMPSALVIFALIIINDRIEMKRQIFFAVMPSLISLAFISTNSFHKLFFKGYDPISNTIISVGPYFKFHSGWMLLYTTFSIVYVVYYSLKYTNGLSKQILIVVCGFMAPIVYTYLAFFKYYYAPALPIPPFINSLIYLFTASCLTYAIIKYRFLDVIPIAMQNVVDNISDSFIIIDSKDQILEINNAFRNEFGKFIDFSNNDLWKALSHDSFKELKIEMSQYIGKTKSTHMNSRFEYEFNADGVNRYYHVEIKLISIHKRFIATFVLFKNITEHKQVMKLIEENANRLIEKAKLISLNQLIGGIAHNIKSPLMSSSGGLLALENYTQRIDQLMSNYGLYDKNPEQKLAIEDMFKWERMIKQYLLYISDIITTVRDQSLSLTSNANKNFTVKEVIERVFLLMDFELKKANCRLKKVLNLSPDISIEGDITVLTQILNNIILNAIQSYDNGGDIDLIVDESEDEILFCVKDFGKGIDDAVKEKIFKEMVTTKGKAGTGLGLYISNIAILGQFKGSIRIESKTGQGSGIFINIPKKTKKRNQAV